MLARLPLKKLSRQITSCPSRNSLSHKWEPRNPAPPVTRVRTSSSAHEILRYRPEHRKRDLLALGGLCAGRRTLPPPRRQSTVELFHCLPDAMIWSFCSDSIPALPR